MQKLKSRKGKIIEISDDHQFYEDYKSAHRNYLRSGMCHEKLCREFKYGENDGIVAGEHDGAHFYTIGQRKGLNIGGKAEPVFVISTDTHNNILYIGMGHSHPGLNRWGLFISSKDLHWIRKDKEMGLGDERNVLVRVRYRQPLQVAKLIRNSEGMYIIFETRQRGITPGQFAAWYEGEELIGSGVIF